MRREQTLEEISDGKLYDSNDMVKADCHDCEGSWVEVTAKVAFENRTEYQGEGIVLYASDVKECEPLKEEMVYFN